MGFVVPGFLTMGCMPKSQNIVISGLGNGMFAWYQRGTTESFFEVTKVEIYNLCPPCALIDLLDPDRIRGLIHFL